MAVFWSNCIFITMMLSSQCLQKGGVCFSLKTRVTRGKHAALFFRAGAVPLSARLDLQPFLRNATNFLLSLFHTLARKAQHLQKNVFRQRM